VCGKFAQGGSRIVMRVCGGMACCTSGMRAV